MPSGGVHPITVERYLRSEDVSRYTPRPAGAGKLGPHEDWLAERVRSALSTPYGAA